MSLTPLVMVPDAADPRNEPEEQRAVENPANIAGNTVHATPSRGGGRPTSSSASQSHFQTESLKFYNAGDMAGPISVDLEDVQQCKATEMIKFLLAFSRSGSDKTVPVHDELLLQCVFEETRKLVNRSGTLLQTHLQQFRNAKNEFDMYEPFVLACNYALDELSGVKVEGLPPFELEKQIVFVHSSDQSIKPTTHWRDTQAKPDIVLLQWKLFLERLSTSFRAPDESIFESPYSKSHTSNFCISNEGLNLSWRAVRSTVEMKIKGLPNHAKPPRDFDKGFWTLEETAPYTSLDDDNQLIVAPEMLPAKKYASRSSDRLSKKPPVTSENAQISSSSKRKMEATVRDDGGEPPNKRARDEVHKDTTAGSSKAKPRGLSQKHPVNIQNGIYAAERLSCSFGVTHSINFILLGSTIYVAWLDRQNVIRTSGFDIVENLPHFLLTLLILQRFDLARWGFFTEFPESSIQTTRDIRQTHILKATFMDEPVNIYPEDDPVYDGINLAGRSTRIAGARENDGRSPSLTNSEDIRKANDLVAKFSWPEETRVREVTFIQRADEMGKTNDLVKGHIPVMFGNIDPPHLTCSTRVIQEFSIKYLDEEDLLIAWLDCLFCHWALWERHIEHGDISIGNLMFDPRTKRGVLSDFDLTREGGPDRKTSAKDNTGTMPFLALDLLEKRAFDGPVPRRYRHDAESFAWCLIYVCMCMEKDETGRIRTIRPHPLSSWFASMSNSYSPKIILASKITLKFLKEPPLHKTKSLDVSLHDYWVTWYDGQLAAQRSARPGSNVVGSLSLSLESWTQPEEIVEEPYKEHSDRESFKRILRLLIHGSVVLETRKSILAELMGLVTTTYPFVKRREVES